MGEFTMMWWQGSAPTTWSYALTTVGMVLFWGLVIFGLIVLMHYFGHGNRPMVDRPTVERLRADLVEVPAWPSPGATVIPINRSWFDDPVERAMVKSHIPT
jgi:hypothetical protein